MSEWVPAWQPASAVGARAREHFCRYLPVEGLVGLADLHSLLVASGRDEVEYGLLVAACGESRESHLATQLHLTPHGWAHHSHPAVPKGASDSGLGGEAEPSWLQGGKGNQERSWHTAKAERQLREEAMQDAQPCKGQPKK